MSPYTPNDSFTEPEIYDLSDLVKGGDAGAANIPLEALYDQATYVKNRLERYESVSVFTGDHAYDPLNDLRKLLVFQISANKTFTLPAVGALPTGTRVTVLAIINAIKALTVLGSEPIIDGGIAWTKWDNDTIPAMYMHDGDKLVLVAAGDHWLVDDAKGNFYRAGESYAGRIQTRNTLIANGTTYTRDDVPRVTKFALSLGAGLVIDSVWLSSPDPSPVFKGCYSSGDGSTTIRVPDERAMSDRYMDLGRGIDVNRLYDNPGGFEEEQNSPHDHAAHAQGKITPNPSSVGAGYLNISDTPLTGRRFSGPGPDPFGLGAAPDLRMRTSVTGLMNIVKNIGKIPLIPY